jgi:hypothetical protein
MVKNEKEVIMSEHLEARIRKLEDIEEIKTLQATYAYSIDTLQMEKVPDLFANDFIAEYVPLGTHTTKESLLEFLKGAGEGAALMRHQMMTPLIEVDGDKATGTWYLLGPFTTKSPEGDIASWIQGKYACKYVREGGKWKFKHLNFTFTFQCPYEDGWVKTPFMQ